ncbi:hypothetical protein HAX54_008912 [Datura stramonium]|uniref:Fungal lipase-type domain-containing protein n=1 Tax=Datura stramonium TaxID=4076 RepID=A0ABS8WZF2_DATST|nr:hypothetical protein [Datura stramonium]
MIISYSRITLFSNGQNPNRNAIPDSTRLFFPGQGKRESTSRNSFKCQVISVNDSPYPITKLQSNGNKFHNDEEAKLANKWRDIHGRNNWEDMLEPIDPLLRAELIRYGDMTQACYDAYNLDRSCKNDPSLFFKITGRSKQGYDFASYIYSKCLTHSIWPRDWSHKANWIGYVAVSDDEYSAHLGRRDKTIAWRKTTKDVEEIADLIDLQRPARDYQMPGRDPTIRIEAGFLKIYRRKDDKCNLCKFSTREQVLNEVKRLIDRYSDEEVSITITGHSLGSALAIINAYDIAEIGLNVREDGRVIPLCVFSFSGPRVGNIRFKQRLEGFGVKVLRVVNKHDKLAGIQQPDY